MNNKQYEFKDTSKKVIEDLVQLAKEGTLSTKQFDKAFSLVENQDEVIQFETASEVSNFLKEQGVSESQHYKYIFTCVDGDDDSLLLLNGWHLCNRLFYVVSTNSWSTGNKEDDGSIFLDFAY